MLSCDNRHEAFKFDYSTSLSLSLISNPDELLTKQKKLDIAAKFQFGYYWS